MTSSTASRISAEIPEVDLPGRPGSGGFQGDDVTTRATGRRDHRDGLTLEDWKEPIGTHADAQGFCALGAPPVGREYDAGRARDFGRAQDEADITGIAKPDEEQHESRPQHQFVQRRSGRRAFERDQFATLCAG